MEWSKKAKKQFLIVCILLTFGSTYLIIDYSSLPTTESLKWEGEFTYITDKTYPESNKAFKIGLGDGFISNIEMIFIHLSLIFGCYEMVDFAMCFEKKKKVYVKEYLTKKYKAWKTKKEDRKK